jgi:hypothetical protein
MRWMVAAIADKVEIFLDPMEEGKEQTSCSNP